MRSRITLIAAALVAAVGVSGLAYGAVGGSSPPKAKSHAASNRGPRGPRGRTGPMGPMGPQGAQGVQGAKGDPGPAGVSGLDANGIKGDPGPAGPAGKDGRDGAPGSHWYIYTLAPNPANRVTGNDGDVWLSTATGALYQKSRGEWKGPVATFVLAAPGPIVQ